MVKLRPQAIDERPGQAAGSRRSTMALGAGRARRIDNDRP
jgi:hypothetical protein